MGLFSLGRGTGKIGRLQLKNGTTLLDGTSAPVDGTSGSGVGQAGPGSIYVNTATSIVYVNTGTKASPTWTPMGGGAAAQREARNASGLSIAAGKPVYLSGWNETDGLPTITLADADAGGAMAEYVTTAAIADGAVGIISKTHRLTGQATNGTSVGDPIYLTTTAGGWSATPPSGADDIIQIIGRVAIVHATTGVVEFDIKAAAKKIGTNEIEDLAVTTGLLAAAAVTKAKLAGGFSKIEIVAGQDETGDTTIPVTGMAVGDELVALLVQDGTSGVLTQRALADFTVGAGVLTVGANAANNAANKYVITWTDLT